MVIAPLLGCKFSVTKQVAVGLRPSGGKQFVDVIASDASGRQILVSLKWQQVSGTAEQKIPYEVICLLEAVRASAGVYGKAYLVLGGEGWTLRPFYTTGGLKKYIEYEPHVEILTLESFVARANRNQL